MKAGNLSQEATRELLVLITLLFYSSGNVVSCSSCQGQVLELLLLLLSRFSRV